MTHKPADVVIATSLADQLDGEPSEWMVYAVGVFRALFDAGWRLSRKDGVDLTERAAVREKADTVVVGECITFPNGLVVDKRPIFLPTPVMPSTPYRVNPGGPSYPGGIPYPPNVAGVGR